MTAGGGNHVSNCGEEIRVMKLSWNPHGLREIEVADPKDIDAGRRGNGIGVGNSQR